MPDERRFNVSLLLNETMFRGLKSLIEDAENRDPLRRKLTQAAYLRDLIATEIERRL